MITRKKFVEATGREPVDDDLERCNCKLAGSMFHTQCGWDKAMNLPVFIAAPYGHKELHDA